MDRTPLYHEIAETIRHDILYGALRPGDELPPVRTMSEQWSCAPGTVQRAYQELADQKLVVSRPGQGTRVAATDLAGAQTPIRRATLVHQAESFLLGVLAAGYTPAEIEQAVRLALDHWRAMSEEPPRPPAHELRFVGSHDPAVSLIAARFPDLVPGYTLSLTFTGSLGGLMALARQEAEIAGSHLWDEETDSYNNPFVQRLLPGRKVALLTLAHRRLGLIVPPGNPAGITGLGDLTRPSVHFINRQPGAGTRVWLDAYLRHLAIAPEQILGYSDNVATHSEVARAVAEHRADAGLGIEAAAVAFGLDFVCLTTERYDLVIAAEAWESVPVQALTRWLATEEARSTILDLGGYDTHATGQIEWVG
jgi:molybdate-binding protein/DNA-binding transcriptional regulator YhcF (GntR family)